MIVEVINYFVGSYLPTPFTHFSLYFFIIAILRYEGISHCGFD